MSDKKQLNFKTGARGRFAKICEELPEYSICARCGKRMEVRQDLRELEFCEECVKKLGDSMFRRNTENFNEG